MFLAGFNCGHCRQRKAPLERGQVGKSIMDTREVLMRR